MTSKIWLLNIPILIDVNIKRNLGVNNDIDGKKVDKNLSNTYF